MKTYDFVKTSKQLATDIDNLSKRFRDMMAEMDIMYVEYNNMRSELQQLKQLDPKAMMAKIKKQIDQEFKHKYGSVYE